MCICWKQHWSIRNVIVLHVLTAARIFMGNSSNFRTISSNGVVYNISCPPGARLISECSYNYQAGVSSCGPYGIPITIECIQSKLHNCIIILLCRDECEICIIFYNCLAKTYNVILANSYYAQTWLYLAYTRTHARTHTHTHTQIAHGIQRPPMFWAEAYRPNKCMFSGSL